MSHRAMALDEHDHLRSSHRKLVDEVADWLGLPDDRDPRVEWRYAQVEGPGVRGTLVLVEIVLKVKRVKSVSR